MKNMMKKGWVIAAAVTVAVLSLFVTAWAVSSYNAYPNTGQYVYNTTGIGGTKLATGSVSQVIYASGGTIHAPNSDGTPGGGDTLIDATARTVGNIGGDGYFYYALNGLTDGSTVYVRCWNASTVAAATHYGDSTTLLVNNPLPATAANWKINSFATTIPKPVATPVVSSATPSSAYRGNTVTSVAIVGSNTHFTAASTVSFGTGITVGSVTYTDPTHVTANNVTIPASVTSGLKTVTVTTAAETATGNVFTVNAPTATASPTSAEQGWSSVTVTITGTGTHFGAGTTANVSGTGVTINSTNVVSATQVTLNLTVASGATVGAHNITLTTALGGTLGTESATAAFSVTTAGTAPVLTSATPATGNQGATLPTVAIVGANTSFTAASTVSFGANITVGSVTYTDANHVTANNVVISSSANTGVRTVSVITGTETATGDVFTVNTGTTTGETSIVIDDMEGTLVPPASYYNFGPSDAAKPTINRITTDKHEGTYAMNNTYISNTDGWRGWGAVLAANKNISACDTITFWMKGDGSDNKVKIQFKDADGDNFAVLDADALALTSTSWQQYSVPISKISSRIGTDGNGTLDLANIAQYQFVFTGASASAGSGILLDYVAATAGSSGTNPTITSISPASGAAGTAVTLVGTNFGSAGDIRFARSGTGTYSIRSTDSNVTSYAANQIVFTTPALSTGTWNVTVYVNAVESNSVSFEVSAGAPGTNDPYNFPNPFNPNQEVTTIVFTPGTSTTATIYIFDSTAKVVQKIAWTGGQARVTWDGKNAYGEIIGDGVYLYRVVDGSKSLGKGKILAVNR